MNDSQIGTKTMNFLIEKLSDRLPLLPALFLFGLVGLASLATPADGYAEDSGSWEYGWIVEPSDAEQLIAKNDLTILDARSKENYESGHITDAIHVAWDTFTPHEASERGKLLDAKALRKKLKETGVDFEHPVLVVGQPPEGWGEAGRIVWMLRTLGHPAAALIDGGHPALVQAGLETSTSKPQPQGGEVRIEETTEWLATRQDVASAIEDMDSVLLDTRERREYEGATPYGESRGGHIPGAAHLHYRDLMNSNGRILPDTEIKRLLQERGIGPSTPIIAYCTGGVRSAWVTVVLTELGYEVKNYAGSTWEWAEHPAETHPLERSE